MDEITEEIVSIESCYHYQLSIVLSAHDDLMKATPELIRTSLRAIEASIDVNLYDIYRGRPYVPIYVETWPGEHYKLLAGFMKVLKPQVVIEIGTAEGRSAFCMKNFLPKGGKIATFDLYPWNAFENTILSERDFEDGSLVQFTDDLGNREAVEKHSELISQASLIFVDAGLGPFKETLLKNLEQIPFSQEVYIIVDDTRVLNAVDFWRNLRFPKLDLTSFGHWSGTGIIKFRSKSS